MNWPLVSNNFEQENSLFANSTNAYNTKWMKHNILQRTIAINSQNTEYSIHGFHSYSHMSKESFLQKVVKFYHNISWMCLCK